MRSPPRLRFRSLFPPVTNENNCQNASPGIIEETEFGDIELLVIDNRSDDPKTLTYLESLERHKNVKIIRYHNEFNFSAINNLAVAHCTGDMLLFLNNDISVVEPLWLNEMLSHAIRPEIGCVGPQLLYPDGRLQHAGVITGIGGVAGHSHKYFNAGAFGYFNRLICVQNVFAVTGACLAVS